MVRDTFKSLVLVLAVVHPFPSANADDIKALQGGWEAVELVEKGERLKAPKSNNSVTFVFEADRVEYGGFFGERGVVKLDESESPKSIDLTLEPTSVGQRQSGTKRMMQGIYELDADELKIAFPNKNGDPRPTKLDPTYIVLRRRVVKGDLEILNGQWKLPRITSIQGDGTTDVTLHVDAMRKLVSVTIDEYAHARGFYGQRTLLSLEGIGGTDGEKYLEVAEYKGNSPTARVAYKVEKDRLRLQGKVQLDALRTIELSGEWQKK